MDPRDRHSIHNHDHYYFPPPPLRNQQRSSPQTTGFPILAIAIIGIITTAFLLLCYYIFAIKCCLNWHRFNILRRFSSSRDLRREEPFIVYATAIENRGLEESVIRAIPIFQYKREGGEEEGKEKNSHECAVCLNEFHEDERLRLLPNCLHSFHIDCIDTWLQSNVNCPLCRSNVSIPNRVFPSNQIIAQNRHQDPRQLSNNRIGNDQNVVIEVTDDGLDHNSIRQEMRNSMEISGQVVTSSHHYPSPYKLGQRILPKKPRKFHHVSSMGDECIDVRGKDDQFSIQPIRRSFSMDSSADRQLHLSVQEILNQNSQIREVNTIEGNSSRVRRGFFSFSHSRGSRNAVLPIQFEP
ncbi:RING-H2 finger protein ATL16-like [Tasmannia lanceolata]|uniref:RING-H2 finger protein ATL16-like n=1 Tax=Tasmannia lanceolata TaxID=3420 RepID=UPI0040649172